MVDDHLKHRVALMIDFFEFVRDIGISRKRANSATRLKIQRRAKTESCR